MLCVFGPNNRNNSRYWKCHNVKPIDDNRYDYTEILRQMMVTFFFSPSRNGTAMLLPVFFCCCMIILAHFLGCFYVCSGLSLGAYSFRWNLSRIFINKELLPRSMFVFFFSFICVPISKDLFDDFSCVLRIWYRMFQFHNISFDVFFFENRFFLLLLMFFLLLLSR